MISLEEINLPEEQIRSKEPISLEFSLSEIYENERYQANVWWNGVRSGFLFDFTWLNYENVTDSGESGNRTIISPIPVQLRNPVRFDDYLRVIFLDPAGQATEVTPRNLGDPVQMTVWPGPDAPSYEPLEDGREPWEPIVEEQSEGPGEFNAARASTLDDAAFGLAGYGQIAYDGSEPDTGQSSGGWGSNWGENWGH